MKHQSYQWSKLNVLPADNHVILTNKLLRVPPSLPSIALAGMIWSDPSSRAQRRRRPSMLHPREPSTSASVPRAVAVRAPRSRSMRAPRPTRIQAQDTCIAGPAAESWNDTPPASSHQDEVWAVRTWRVAARSGWRRSRGGNLPEGRGGWHRPPSSPHKGWGGARVVDRDKLSVEEWMRSRGWLADASDGGDSGEELSLNLNNGHLLLRSIWWKSMGYSENKWYHSSTEIEFVLLNFTQSWGSLLSFALLNAYPIIRRSVRLTISKVQFFAKFWAREIQTVHPIICMLHEESDVEKVVR
jgi:hypothetical protein